MRRNTRRSGRQAEGRSRQKGEMAGLVSRMSCTCAEHARHGDAPLACAMFRRVEIDGQSVSEAAEALGLRQGDGRYLLGGLRRDLAVELATALLSGEEPHGPASPPREPS